MAAGKTPPRRRLVLGLLFLFLAVAGAAAALAYAAYSGGRGANPVAEPPPIDPDTPVPLDIPAAPGLKLYLQPNDIIVSNVLRHNKVWEPNETLRFTQVVRPGDTVIDVGANIGYYTVLASRLVGESGRVVAFEPDPAAFAILERNLRLNGCRNVTAEPKALSDKPGTLKLFLAPFNKGDHRIYQPNTEQPRRSVAVEAVALDDYLAARPGPVNVIKMDVQGAEGVVAAGMARTLAANAGHLVVFSEFWPHALGQMGSDPAAYLARFTAHGFRFFDLTNDVGPLRELTAAAALAENAGQGEQKQTNLLMLPPGRDPPPDP